MSVPGSRSTLKFSLKRYFAQMSTVLKQAGQSDWYHRSSRRTRLLSSSFNFAKELELRRFYYPLWLKRFSGLIPAHWEYWRNVFTDLDAANTSRIRLDATLLDAAVMHPYFLIAKKTAQTQPLTTHQLCWLFSRPYFLESPGFKTDLAQLQKELGAKPSDLDTALKVSDRVKHKLSHWHSRHRFPSVELQTDSLLQLDLPTLTLLLESLKQLQHPRLTPSQKKSLLHRLRRQLPPDLLAGSVTSGMVSVCSTELTDLIAQITQLS